ncbi:MAG: DUF2019 domain-containing protein [Pseudomonadota bacterium]
MSKQKNLSPSEMVDAFRDCCLALYDASERDDTRKYNRLIGRLLKIINTLREMPGDQRKELLVLYAHPNVVVRLQSAILTVDLAPLEAKRIFEGIKASRIYPYAADASYSLGNLEGDT